MEFNFGDRVCVSKHIVSYSTTGKRDLYGTVGVIVDKTPTHYGVKLAGLRSHEDKDGLFWFKPQDIIPQEEMGKLDDKKNSSGWRSEKWIFICHCQGSGGVKNA